MGLIQKANTFSAGATIIASEHNDNFDTLYSEINGNIENTNIRSNAAIVATKLNLSTIAQAITMSNTLTMTGDINMSGDLTMTGIVKTGKGSDVASGTSIALGDDGNFFDITGTTDIQTITIKTAGTHVWLQFDGALSLIDNTGNLELQGADVAVSAEDLVCLISDGTNWHLVASTASATNLAIPSEAQGDILYQNGTVWTRLGAGTDGQFLQTQGAGANPQWATPGFNLVTATVLSTANSGDITIAANKIYKIVFQYVMATDTGIGSLRFNSDASSASYNLVDGSGTTATEIPLTGGSTVANGDAVFGEAMIDTTKKANDSAFVFGTSLYEASGNYTSGTIQGVWLDNATISNFEILVSGGTMTGTLLLYELALS